MEMHLGWLSFWFFLMVLTVIVGGGVITENQPDNGDSKTVLGAFTLIGAVLVALLASITIYNVYVLGTENNIRLINQQTKYSDLMNKHNALHQKVISLDKINAELMVDNVETKIEKRETTKKLKLLNIKRKRMLTDLKNLTTEIEND